MTPLFGILLAVGCALATNIGFLYKHRGVCEAPPVDMRHPVRTARALFRSRLFTIGMGIAAFAWLLHVGALSLAPMSIVQSVLAGGMVLLAVMAERMFGLRIGRRQWLGLAATAVGLIMLGVTLPAAHGADSRYSLPGMIAFEGALVAGGTLLIVGPRIGARREHHGYMLGAAAGILLGVSDVGIKAISGMVTGSSGIAGFLTPWLAVALAAAVGAFYASAKSLQEGEPVPVIAVTGTSANLAGIVGGIIVFGDPMAGSPSSLAVQVMAFALVLLAAWLMPAPVRAAGAGGLGAGRPASLPA
jgi:drug/metabolite transporter (DMT)-like permease